MISVTVQPFCVNGDLNVRIGDRTGCMANGDTSWNRRCCCRSNGAGRAASPAGSVDDVGARRVCNGVVRGIATAECRQ